MIRGIFTGRLVGMQSRGDPNEDDEWSHTVKYCEQASGDRQPGEM